MSQDILLEQEQKDLLIVLVEASRNVKRDERHRFLVIRTEESDVIYHNGLPNGEINTYFGDIETLANEHLLNLTCGSKDTLQFDVKPSGFKYYEQLKKDYAQPLEKIEMSVVNYMKSEFFIKEYKGAFDKWTKAEELLWKSDSDEQFTSIGHHCREALQDFIRILVNKFKPSEIGGDKARTISRLKTIIALFRENIGETEEQFLDALIDYWEAINNLIQRQEHGNIKEGKSLVWLDGRRVVFLTAIVMYEVATTILKIKKSN